MPSGSPDRRLRDIVENARAIIEDVGAMSQAEFVGNRLAHDAVLYRLLKISEAARKLGQTAEDLAPGLPWPRVRALGNAIRHDYDAIRLDEVWAIVQRDLPPLLHASEEALRRLGDRHG